MVQSEIRDKLEVIPWIQEEDMSPCLKINFGGKPFMRVYLKNIQELYKKDITFSQVTWEIINRFQKTDELLQDYYNSTEPITRKEETRFIVQLLTNTAELNENYKNFLFPLVPIYKDMFYFPTQKDAEIYFLNHNVSLGWAGAIMKFDTLQIRETDVNEPLDWSKLEFKPENCKHEISIKDGVTICAYCDSPLDVVVSVKDPK